MEAQHAANHVKPSVISTDTDYNLTIAQIIFSFKKLLTLDWGDFIFSSCFTLNFLSKLDKLFFPLKLIFGVTNWDGEIEGKKDKDITALTDRSHMKVALLCLLATLCRKRGTKKMKRREK